MNEEEAERTRRCRILDEMTRDAEQGGLAARLDVTPDDVVKLQDQEAQSWAADIARGLEDLRSGRVTVWDRRLMARLGRIFPRKRRKK